MVKNSLNMLEIVSTNEMDIQAQISQNADRKEKMNLVATHPERAGTEPLIKQRIPEHLEKERASFGHSGRPKSCPSDFRKHGISIFSSLLTRVA